MFSLEKHKTQATHPTHVGRRNSGMSIHYTHLRSSSSTSPHHLHSGTPHFIFHFIIYYLFHIFSFCIYYQFTTLLFSFL
ncbi:hypothetical protein BGS_0594 [Beggiatoa sp. SS]|nr:hypothetical protein BGS_0594 [Beggiatoa sp. SS]